MLMNLNGRERTQSAFEAIFSSVTPKLRLLQIHRPAQGELSLIEVTLADSPLQSSKSNGVTNGVHANGTHANGVNGH
jgi:hypothetical protein